MMDKKINYDNKCTLVFHSVQTLFDQGLADTDVHGRHVIYILKNGYIGSGYVSALSKENLVVYSFDKDKFNSMCEILQSDDLSNLGIDKYPQYPEYRKTIEDHKLHYKMSTVLDYAEWVLFTDGCVITKESPDIDSFKENVINLLEYHDEIDYYSRGNVIGLTEDGELNVYYHLPSIKAFFSSGSFVESKLTHINSLYNFNLISTSGEIIKLD